MAIDNACARFFVGCVGVARLRPGALLNLHGELVVLDQTFDNPGDEGDALFVISALKWYGKNGHEIICRADEVD